MSESTVERSSPAGTWGSTKVKSPMMAPLDDIDSAILRELEDDSRLSADTLAVRIGTSSKECEVRIAELERAGHIGGYTLVREYPDPTLRPVSAVIRVVQDQTRTGADLLRFLECIPEIITAEIHNDDHSLLLRVETKEPARVEAIASALRIQLAVVSVEVYRTTKVMSNPRPMPRRLL